MKLGPLKQHVPLSTAVSPLPSYPALCKLSLPGCLLPNKDSIKKVTVKNCDSRQDVRFHEVKGCEIEESLYQRLGS